MSIEAHFRANAQLVAEALLPGKHFKVLGLSVNDDRTITFFIDHDGEEGLPAGGFIPEYKSVGPCVGAPYGYAIVLDALRPIEKGADDEVG